jgi:hypothetical protein
MDIVKFKSNSVIGIYNLSDSFGRQPLKRYAMTDFDKNPGRNENIDGYKVEGDGNAPNTSNPPKPGNKSFEKNPDAVTEKSEKNIPGKEFNINDKAYFDSSKEDFVQTVSKMHHANEDFPKKSRKNK